MFTRVGHANKSPPRAKEGGLVIGGKRPRPRRPRPGLAEDDGALGLSGLGVAGGFILEAPEGDRLVRGGTAGFVAAADRHAHGTHANRDDE